MNLKKINQKLLKEAFEAAAPIHNQDIRTGILDALREQPIMTERMKSMFECFAPSDPVRAYRGEEGHADLRRIDALLTLMMTAFLACEHYVEHAKGLDQLEEVLIMSGVVDSAVFPDGLELR